MTDVKFAALGLDHRHIFGMSQGLIEHGAQFSKFWTHETPHTLEGFQKRFPGVPRSMELNDILEDASINLVLIAAAPADRARLSILAMEHGKDVMIDKPGCLNLTELADIKRTITRTGRIWSVNFSERFEVPATTMAEQLLSEGCIGEVVQVLSLAPHRLNAPTRPDWFWDAATYGGILGDIGVHQIDQFLHFTGSKDAEIIQANVGNYANPQAPNFQDFGELSLRCGNKHGYTRLDWYTPDGLPNWGDGRLTLLGTEGYIELRKYVDVAGRSGTDHVFLVNKTRCEHIDASKAGTPYFSNLLNDVRDRTETSCAQDHTLTVMRLAINAQALANENTKKNVLLEEE